MRWPRFSRRGHSTPEAAVVAEAEAILEGRALDAYRDRGLAVPPWLVVNSLAHAPVDRLRRMADAGAFQHPGSIAATLGRLARGVLAMGPAPEDVVAVQRGLLVQVELFLLGNGGSSYLTVPELETMLDELLSCCRERREFPGPVEGGID
jgi:hypothetical protein